MTDWHKNIQNFKETLESLSIRDIHGHEIDADSAFALWRDQTISIRKTQKTVYLIGNGASASMASHFAADLAKNAHLHTEVFSDLSLITAISNDMGYEWVFAEPLRRRARKGDMLVAISSSGSSKNIRRAVEVVQGAGLNIVSLSAMSSENPLRSSGHLNIYVPAQTYGYAETCHTAILHYWMDMVGM